MKKYLIFMNLFWGLYSFSQEYKSPLSNAAFLFTFKQNSYLISGDSIFNNQNKKEWVGSKHNLVIKDFVFFQDDVNGYLMHNSGGIIYRFDGVNFTRIDDSFEFNTQYQSFPFLYNGSIFNFGGYGLFTFKNIFTYFNESKKETELVKVKTPGKDHPDGRKKMFAQLVGDTFYMGSGLGYNSNKENPYSESDFLTDYWNFNLKTSEWTKLGEGIVLNKSQEYSIIYNYKGKNLILADEKVYGVAIKSNTLDYYENANIDLLKSKKIDPVRNYITYNPSEKGFYLILNKSNLINKLVFVSEDDFIGLPTRTENLYESKDNQNEYVFVFFFFLIVGIGLIVFKKKNTFENVTINKSKIESVLNEEENKIFSIIYQNHPDFTPFPDLMNVFEPHLSYESRKKKLRHSLYQIEEKMDPIFKTKNQFFIERKNKEDLRIKEIRIK